MEETGSRDRAPLTVSVDPSYASPPRLSPADLLPGGVAGFHPLSAVDGRFTPPGSEPASYASLTTVLPLSPIDTVSDNYAGNTFTFIEQQTYASQSPAPYNETLSPQAVNSRRSVSPNSFERRSPTPPLPCLGLDLNATLLAGEEQQAQNDTEEINTKELVQSIKGELNRYQIPQAVFAQKVLYRSQGTLCDMLRNPKPWSKLKSGKETYRRMWKWLQEPEFQRLSALRLAEFAPDIANKKSAIINSQLMDSFKVPGDADIRTSGFRASRKSRKDKGSIVSVLSKEAIISTRKLDDMIILNGDIDTLPAPFIFKSIELESKTGSAGNCSKYRSYTQKISYTTLKRKLSRLNEQVKIKNIKLAPKEHQVGVLESDIKTAIVESFSKYATDTPTTVNLSLNVKHTKTSEVYKLRNNKTRKFDTPKIPEITRKCNVRQTRKTSHKATKTPTKNTSKEITPNQLETTQYVGNFIENTDVAMIPSAVSLVGNEPLVEQILPTLEIEDTFISETTDIHPVLHVSQLGKRPEISQDLCSLATFEKNILPADCKTLSSMSDNIDIIMQSSQLLTSNELIAKIKPEINDSTTETQHSPVRDETVFVLGEDLCSSSVELMPSIKLEIDDTPSVCVPQLGTDERMNLFISPKTEENVLEGEDQTFTSTNLITIGDVTVKTDPLVVTCEVSELLTTPQVEEHLFKDANQSSSPNRVIASINPGTCDDVTTKIGDLIVTGVGMEGSEAKDNLLEDGNQISISNKFTASINGGTCDDVTAETDNLVVTDDGMKEVHTKEKMLEDGNQTSTSNKFLAPINLGICDDVTVEMDDLKVTDDGMEGLEITKKKLEDGNQTSTSNKFLASINLRNCDDVTAELDDLGVTGNGMEGPGTKENLFEDGNQTSTSNNFIASINQRTCNDITTVTDDLAVTDEGMKEHLLEARNQSSTSTNAIASINQGTCDDFTAETDELVVNGEDMKENSLEDGNQKSTSNKFISSSIQGNDVTAEMDDLKGNLFKDRHQTSASNKFIASINQGICDNATAEIDDLVVTGKEMKECETKGNENPTSILHTFIASTNRNTSNTISGTDNIKITDAGTEVFLTPQNVQMISEALETDPLKIMTEITDLTLSPGNVEIVSDVNEAPEINTNEFTSTTVKVSKPKLKTSSQLKYTVLSTDIKRKLLSNVKKLNVHIARKPADLLEIFSLSFFRKNKKAIKKCKPLTITLVDHKVYANTTKLDDIEVHDDIENLTKYIQQKSNPEGYCQLLKQEKTKNIQKCNSVREQSLRKGRSTNIIEILDLSLNMMEQYEIDKHKNIITFKKNKLPNDFDIVEYMAETDKNDPTKAIVCCWYKRQEVVKSLYTKYGQHTSFTFIKQRHACPLGKCKCCKQCQNDKGQSSLVSKMEKRNQSSYKIVPLSIPAEPKTLIDKALAYAQNTSFKNKLSVISDNIVSSAQKHIEALTKPWLINEIIEIHNISPGNAPHVEIYDIDNRGEVQTLTKIRHADQKSKLVQGNRIDVSKKINSFNTCCWNKREQLIEKLRNIKVKPETIKFIREKHMCPIDDCHCCCPYVQVINLKVDKNETFNKFQTRNVKVPKKVKQLNVTTDNKKIRNTISFKDKDETLMQSIIDEEISNLIKDSNSPSSTCYKVGLDKSSHTLPAPKYTNPTKLPEAEHQEIKIEDNHGNQYTDKTLSNDMYKIPTPPAPSPPLNQSQPPPIVEVNTIISQILNRFQGLRLNIDENGNVQAVLENTLDNVSSLELTLLKQILTHAQSLVDKHKITSNANLSNMMGLSGNPNLQLSNDKSDSVNKSRVYHLPTPSISTQVPKAQTNNPKPTNLIFKQTSTTPGGIIVNSQPNHSLNPIIQDIYSCQPNSMSAENPIIKKLYTFQPNPTLKPNLVTENYVNINKPASICRHTVKDTNHANMKPMLHGVPNPIQGQLNQPEPRFQNPKHTVSVTELLSNYLQTKRCPPKATAQSAATTRTSNPCNTTKTYSYIRPGVSRVAPNANDLNNLTLANLLSTNKTPNFPTNPVRPSIHSPGSAAPITVSSTATSTEDLPNKKSRRSRRPLKSSKELVSRIQPVVLPNSNPPPLRPLGNWRTLETAPSVGNNAYNNSLRSDLRYSQIPRMVFADNDAATLTHVSNTRSLDTNPIPVLTNVVSLKLNPKVNIAEGVPTTIMKNDTARSNQSEISNVVDTNSSSTDSAPETDADSSSVTVWYRKPQPSKSSEGLGHQSQASGSKHKKLYENITKDEKKIKLSRNVSLMFPMPKTDIKEEVEDEIDFFEENL